MFSCTFIIMRLVLKSKLTGTGGKLAFAIGRKVLYVSVHIVRKIVKPCSLSVYLPSTAFFWSGASL